MELIFIGTSSGIESLSRFHSSFLIQSNEYNLLVDAGDGISKALLKQKIDYHSINGIIFTHFHPDHFSGLGGLIVQMELSQRVKPLQIFTHKKLIPYVKDYLHLSYLFEKKLSFEIEFIGFEYDNFFTISDEIKVISRHNTHVDASKQYDIENRNFFSSSSLLIQLGDKKLFYSGDIGNKDDLLLFSDISLDIMICEITHISTEDIIEAVKTLHPSSFYLTHISDSDSTKIESIINHTSIINIPTFEAFDGLKFNI